MPSGIPGTVNLVGKTKDRESNLQWLATTDCLKCANPKRMEVAQVDDIPVEILLKSSTSNVAGRQDFRLIAIATGGTYQQKVELRVLGRVYTRRE